MYVISNTYNLTDKKLKYPGAADIPIVRLNPFGILDIKKEGEQALRDSGALYTRYI
jgi:hypothetical protein